MILESYYQSYKSCAESIDWVNTSVFDLCDEYIKNEKDILISNMYLSAIILKYWNKISFYCYKGHPVVKAEDAYEWLVNSILNTLKNRPWQDPNSKLYRDNKAPDKCINVGILHERANWYQASNRDKRSVNYVINSLDELRETINYEKPSNESYEDKVTTIDKELVIKYFAAKKYFISFLVDILCNGNCKLGNYTNIQDLHLSRLCQAIMDIQDELYLNYFSKHYGIDVNQVKLAAEYLKLKPSEIKEKIKRSLHELKHDEIVHAYRGY